jgi:ABC-type bacteriocin/lantibiotic exporter with double-glycine peptidase domain
MTSLRGRHRARAFLAPEVVQTSAMDCGPASLKCLLEGFGIPASYARLQEACQTDVDGTSINTIEQIAVALGLEAEQVMLPLDHVLLEASTALPALVVVRRENVTHFLIAWRRQGPFVQVMDPAKGRRWLRVSAFEQELYRHAQPVPASAWREWAGDEEFAGGLRERLAALKVPTASRQRLIDAATADASWRGLAMLDASTRMVADLVRAGGVARGRSASALIEACIDRMLEGHEVNAVVPAQYWSVFPSSDDEERVTLGGAVLLRIQGRRPSVTTAADDPSGAPSAPLPPSLTRALEDAGERPMRQLWRLLRRDSPLMPSMLGAAVGLVAVGTVVELLLLRGFLEIHNVLALREHRLVAVGVLLAVVAAMLLLETAVSAGVLQIGRRLETRLRAAVLDKLPRLSDQFFRSRLVSDMAHRAHALDALRAVPDLCATLGRVGMQLALTAIGLAWLDPGNAWTAAAAAAIALVIPMATVPVLAERELRQRSHSAALSRHYLDSLLGLVAARTHGAERALRQRHETMLVEWGRASLHLLRGGVVVEGFQTLVGSMLAAWLVLSFASRGTQPGSTLLLVYWALNLPVLGRELSGALRQVPALLNILRRLFEPLNAPEEPAAASVPTPDATGVSIHFAGVHMQAAGHAVLNGIDLQIAPGEHIAVVGRSGAGKSSLVGMLLGWRHASAGRILVDGHVLDAARVGYLRSVTAWVDPAVALWNRSLFDNLRYGDQTAMISNIGSLLETAQLIDVLEKLPGGLQSPLGEGGRLTSGGEGQRVRFGRALTRQHVRLAVLDEPFRGVDREQRHTLLERARGVWREATLICVTHDIDETLAFARVLVVDEGRVVEDGDPAELAARPDSLYAALLAAERTVRRDLWESSVWRRWHLQGGRVTEQAPPAEAPFVSETIADPGSEFLSETTWNQQSTSRGR